MKRFLFLILSLAATSFAEETIFYEEQGSDKIQTIRFVGKWDQVASPPKLAHNTVTSDRVFLLGVFPEFLEKIQQDYVGQPITRELISSLEKEITSFYMAKGQSFVVVGVPAQNLKSGNLQIVVSEANFGELRFKGNNYSSPERLKTIMGLKSGDPVNELDVLKEMSRMNQTPFRRTDAYWRAGKKMGTVDLELDTIDRFPYRFYMGADNTGTINTERDRFFFGLNFGKTIVADSELSYQFTCSPNWNRFVAQTALCRVPFPAGQTLIFYGGYSKVEPDLNDKHHEKARSWQVDGRYRIPIITNTRFIQELLLGYDFKQVISRISKNGKRIFYGIADVDQLMLGYDAGLSSKNYKMSFVAEIYGNPGWLSKHNETKDYQPFRANSGPGYVYGKLSHAFAYNWYGWAASYDVNGQLSSKNLLPSEQFTLAGYNAVRGFEERIVNTDNAFLLNLTLQTPKVSISKMAGWTRRDYDELYFLAFFDYGLGGNHLFGPDESRTKSLASIGPGVRYQIDRFVTARFDYGFQLFHHGFHNPTNSRYNFGLIVSF